MKCPKYSLDDLLAVEGKSLNYRMNNNLSVDGKQ